jgi:hypothetical protein
MRTLLLRTLCHMSSYLLYEMQTKVMPPECFMYTAYSTPYERFILK